ncbi:MAG: minichromosome maintenance protein MCM, partial [Methanobacterium sp.]|nr:minichromosome maintenance protein MCM [Methanobacterium sp.]
APSIHGYRDVKEAIALQLFGGAGKELDDKTRLRGDIHVLIVGDPGIGKSQMLKYVSKLAPRGIYTSGKGTSGVGLTAAAVRDEFGGWSLEAGALVLGDKGNVCVDELDKMRDEDRSAIHEALEQQTISIAKAGIMATLNSRCSVLAAANPKFGRFDSYKSLAEQIDLPSTILSRFDLTFVVEDKPEEEKDRSLARHILNTHKEDNMHFEIDPELLRKYIAYARRNIHPILTDPAMDVLEEFYVSMRNNSIDDDSPVPITARQLEAIIRLSEASAKIKLKTHVEAEDAHQAIKLTQACLKQVGLDPETGKIDIDKVEGRPPKSERDKFRILIEVVKELEEEYGGRAPTNILISEMADRYNVSEEKVEEVVRILKHKGVIFEPSRGYLKVV